MENVKVNKAQLLETVKTNRDNHRTVFEKAVEVYREEIVQVLESKIASILRGDKIDHFISLPVPEDHTDDYDRAIQMLEMSVDDVIEIDEISFNQFVRDEWGWQRSFMANTVGYAARA